MSSSHYVPSSSRPTVFAPGQKESLKKKYETLSSSKSSSGSSSDSYDGPIVTTEENRASFPSPAPKFPLSITEISTSHPSSSLWCECLAEVNLILQQEELDFDSLRLDTVRGADAEHMKPSILIRVPEGTDKSRWRSILITIGQILHVKDSLELQVMIMEPGAEEYDRAFSIEGDDPLIHDWPESLKEPIFNLIENMDWLELSVCNWGHTRDSAKPTVLIIVEEKIEGAWDDVCRRISGTCAESGLPGLQIVVEEGELMGTFVTDDAGLRQGHQSYQEKVSMGHSIGVEPKGGGTLGGFLNLVNPNNPADKTTVLLTNWHVVRPSDSGLPVEWDDGPHKYGDWPKSISNDIHSPARADVASGITYRQTEIETIKSGESWQLLGPQVRDGTASDRQRKLFERQVQSVKSLAEQVDYLNSINNKALLRLGQCKMASGYRKARLANPDGGVEGVFALDWAIGEVDSERIGGNLLPAQGLLDSVSRVGRFFLDDNTFVKDISVSPLYESLDVFKIGRATGLTVGAIERLSSYVKVKRQSNSKQKAPMRTTLEMYAVRGLYGTPFNKAGDSGAWILDPLGDLVGLLWVGCEKSGHGYFTPIRLVVDDIENFTGKKVEMYQGR